MTREQRIVATFVEFADTMVDDFDVVEFLHRLAERCVQLLDCAEAGILLADAAGALRVMASSSERADALDLLQSQNEEGPCFECHRRGRQVTSDDLRLDTDRWPAFAPLAVEMGFGSVHAIPMRVRGETVGALNLFRAAAGAIDAADGPLAQGIADIAAIALLQERAAREARGVVEQLQQALSSRVVIEQAKGILAERVRISVDNAFNRLRGHARHHNQRLSDVARELIEGRLDAAALDESAAYER
ncbi:MAG: GAF and ANTAR domain-containing protein [Solirubrobacteraceae bacterium]